MEQKKVIGFEKEHGTDMLIKTIISSVNRLLVDKGVITEEELSKAMIGEMEIVDVLCSLSGKKQECIQNI